ncbi:MAG: transposase [Myxococcales bacterium]
MQRDLPFPKPRGGKREGAGRPKGSRVSHHQRPRFGKATPVHVTVRVRRHVWNLRSRRCYRRIGECLEQAAGRFGLRVIEYSVLGDHVHLIVEADSAEALARGMQGLSIRIAKSLTALMNGGGPLVADHYDGRPLTTPTALVRAIAYVLRNHEHHFGARGRDPFSSDGLDSEQRRTRLSLPLSWLLTSGWRRAAPSDLHRLRGFRFASPRDAPTSGAGSKQ